MDYNEETIDVRNSAPEFPLPPALTTTEIPELDEHTIECDLRAFTRWLNALKDQVNYLTHIYADLRYLVESNFYRIYNLEVRMTEAENNITNLQQRMEIAEGDIINLKNDVTELNGALNNLSSRVDLLYSWLPIPYGLIDPKGWKFAMGNINVMSDNNGTPSLNVGIFTSPTVEDNDIYFN